jgi:hypothetical protein
VKWGGVNIPGRWNSMHKAFVMRNSVMKLRGERKSICLQLENEIGEEGRAQVPQGLSGL